MASLLLVDEDRDSCQLAKRVLSREGHIAEALTMPQDALAWLGGNVPSLAIVSAGKYGEKARTTLELFKKAGISGSRIVLLAETGDLAAVRRSFGNSVLAVIEKDSSFERLIELIHTVEVEKMATTR